MNTPLLSKEETLVLKDPLSDIILKLVIFPLALIFADASMFPDVSIINWSTPSFCILKLLVPAPSKSLFKIKFWFPCPGESSSCLANIILS